MTRTKKMDVLEFRLNDSNFGYLSHPQKIVDIYINGNNFIEIVEKYECKMRGIEYNENNADYAGLMPEELYDNLTGNCYNAEKPYVLGCVCGVTGCNPLAVTIDMEKDAIKWHDFENCQLKLEPGNDTFDWNGIGPYVFKPEQYFKIIQELRLWVVATYAIFRNDNLTFEEALSLVKRVEIGDVNAAEELGKQFFSCSQITNHYYWAVKYLKFAVERGSVKGLNPLGICYELGRGISKNKSRAAWLYKKGAVVDDSDCLNNLGLCYIAGSGVKKNYKKAFELFNRAYKLGSLYSIANIGECYYYGRGVKKDYFKAVKYFEKSAQNGDMKAENGLARCYYKGNGVKQDLVKAIDLYKDLYNKGQEKAAVIIDKYYDTVYQKGKDEKKIYFYLKTYIGGKNEWIEEPTIGQVEEKIKAFNFYIFNFIIVIPSIDIQNSKFIQVCAVDTKGKNPKEKDKYRIEIRFELAGKWKQYAKETDKLGTVLAIFKEYIEEYKVPNVGSWKEITGEMEEWKHKNK